LSSEARRPPPFEDPAPASPASGLLRRLIFRLRVEEAIALAFLLPTTYLTVAANVYARREGVLGARHPGGLARLAVALAFLALLHAALRLRPRSPAVRALREVLPFLTCILIYTNLHDTIGFVNTNDVHHYLAALDQMLFGVQPCVWTERFISRGLTEVMSILYFNFFWIAPSTSLLLLARGRWREFRATTMGVVTCFYLGYALYVAFPAAPPRLVLVYEFTKTLQGYPHLFSNLSARAFELLPVDSRAAFPSLHAAVSLVALIYAWRHLRAWFWVLVPFAAGLWASTVYLRHHYVVDLFAGWALAPVAVWVAPRVDRWWAARQAALGHKAARGAEPCKPPALPSADSVRA
jgi:membrane-associated phospholipid phosphatase